MREIKFRAWDRKGKRMLQRAVPGTVTYFDDNGNAEAADCDVMQYTGLKDKNGKDVFEGDIIRFTVPSGKVQTAEVVWYEDKLKFCKTLVGRTKYSGLTNPKRKHVNFEVIGNIYENPELLPATNGVRD